MKFFYDVLNQYVAENQPNFGDGDSLLPMLYEVYSECNRLDDAQIKANRYALLARLRGLFLGVADISLLG